MTTTYPPRTRTPTYWSHALRQLWARPLNRACILALLLLVLFCFAGPSVVKLAWGWTYDLQQVNLGATPPSLAHPFGTDPLGRDVLVRTMHGGRVSLALALLATLVSLGIGVVYGALSGYLGGQVDAAMMRVVDLMLSFPYLLVVVVLLAMLPPAFRERAPLGGTFTALVLALGLVGWLVLARITRAEVLVLREQPFVLAARAMGLSTFQVLRRHVIPNALGPIVVYTTFTAPGILAAEAFLSFLGLGIREPHASWGTLLRDGANTMVVYPWLLAFPALAMTLTLLCTNLLGDGLRDALDPHAWREGGPELQEGSP